MADLLIIGFFFLMRPGEYCDSGASKHPFRLRDIELHNHNTSLPWDTTPTTTLHRANFITLTFTTQKNAIRGEKIGHGLSSHPTICPVKAIVRRILYLRAEGATPTTPIHMFKRNTLWRPVRSSEITTAMRLAARNMPHLGITEDKLEARSLRAGGAMALLNSGASRTDIQLFGRWLSDSMIRYLHVQAHNRVSGYAKDMFNNGDYTLHPHLHTP